LPRALSSLRRTPEGTIDFIVGDGAIETRAGASDEKVEYWIRVRVEQ